MTEYQVLGEEAMFLSLGMHALKAAVYYVFMHDLLIFGLGDRLFILPYHYSFPLC